MATASEPVIIVGAGVAGLVLAQACRKQNVPFRIFERDGAEEFRPAGWALTLHWSLSMIRALLPDDTLARFPDCYVNKVAQANGERGAFPFYDMCNGDVKWPVPAGERVRVSRARLRTALLTGLDVEWSKSILDIQEDPTGGVTASFTDGTAAKGRILVGTDGAHSKVRRLIAPSIAANWQLPVRICGTKINVPESEITALKKLDPYFFQGGDPRTDVFTYVSFVDAPCDRPELQASADGTREAQYVLQVMVSWPYRAGFWGREEPTDVPATAEEQLAWIKAITCDWVEPFRSIFQNIPSAEEVKPIVLDDWVPIAGSLTAMDSRVVLLGDAAHAMVMYRGEGANHAIADVFKFSEHVLPLLGTGCSAGSSEHLKRAIEAHGNEAFERGSAAVMMSRQACLDGHDQRKMSDESPLVGERRIRADVPSVKGALAGSPRFPAAT